MRINKKLVKRLVESKYERTNGEYETVEHVDMRFLPAALGLVVLILIVSIPTLTLLYDFEKWLVRKPGPPPKVITRVIHTDALTAAQHEFIQQCESNTSNDGQQNRGIPYVYTTPWTCTFAK